MRSCLLSALIGGLIVVRSAAIEPTERAETTRQRIVVRLAQGPYLRAHCGCGNIEPRDFRNLEEAQRQLATVTDLAAPETDRWLFEGREFRLQLFLAVQDSAMTDATKLTFARRAAMLDEDKLPVSAVLPVAYGLHAWGTRQDLPLLVRLARRHPELVAGLAMESCVRLGGAPCDLLLFDEAAELNSRRSPSGSADRDARESLARRVREFLDSAADTPPSLAN